MRNEVEPGESCPDILTALQAKLMLFFTGATRDSWSILREHKQQREEART